VCGRFNLSKPKDVIERFGFLDWADKRVQPRFNIAVSPRVNSWDNKGPELIAPSSAPVEVQIALPLE
jgi:hypothetical protein